MSITPPTVLAELRINGAWVDISADVRVDPAIVITHGVSSPTGTADPATCTMAWNNRSGQYSPRNPAGPYYGFLNRNTPLRLTVDGDVRFWGEVSEFPPEWTVAGGNAWVTVVASGVLRRLAQGTLLQSTLYTAVQSLVPAGHIVGYWPMEDEPGSTSLAPAISGINPGIISGPLVLAAVDGGVASKEIPTWAGAAAEFGARPSPGTTGFTAGFLLVTPPAGTANGAELLRVFTAGSIHTWTVNYVTGGQLRVRGYATAAGVTAAVVDQTGAFAVDGISSWVTLETHNVTTTVGWALTATPAGTISNTVAGHTVTGPISAVIGAGGLITGDVGIGHLVLGDIFQALFTLDFGNAVKGYAGDTVVARMTRLAAQAGVDVDFISVTGQGAEMGAVPDGTALDAMRAAEAADVGGILCDDIDDLGLLYFTRRARYNDLDGATRPAIAYTGGALLPPLRPTDDDATLRNDVTVTRSGGSSARAVKTTGALNASPFPDGVNAYPYAVTLSLWKDDQLTHVAGWLLALGTIDETRFPVVQVDLLVNGALTTLVELIRPGHRITLSGLPAWLPPGDLDLAVIGWTETIGSHIRTISLNCVPAGVFDVVQLDDTVYGRLDSATTVTNEALDATETGVDYTGDTWVTTATVPAAFPFGILIGGELMTVTAATGSTFTVTRSVNGVVKTHAIGAPINVADAVRLAL